MPPPSPWVFIIVKTHRALLDIGNEKKIEVILISMLNVGQVDYIVTPTKIITCEGEKRRPTGIQWSKVTPKMLKEIPVLKDLREKERRLGRDVTLRE